MFSSNFGLMILNPIAVIFRIRMFGCLEQNSCELHDAELQDVRVEAIALVVFHFFLDFRSILAQARFSRLYIIYVRLYRLRE